MKHFADAFVAGIAVGCGLGLTYWLLVSLLRFHIQLTIG